MGFKMYFSSCMNMWGWSCNVDKLLFIKAALQKFDFLRHGICFSLQRTKFILEPRDTHLFQGAALSREASVCELTTTGRLFRLI